MATAAQQSIPHGALIHYASESGLVDQSAYARTGATYEGGMGVSGGAYLFDGVDDHIDFGTVPFVATEGFSFSAWVKPGDTDVLERFWHSQSGSTATFVVQINNTVNPGEVQVAMTWDTAASVQQRTTTTTLTAGVWQRLVVTHDGTNSATAFRVYLNGTECSYRTASDVAGGTTVDDITSLFFGARLNVGDRFFTGSAESFVLHPYALTAAEVLTEYNAGRQANYTHPKFDKDRQVKGCVLHLRGETGAVDQSDVEGVGVVANGNPTWSSGGFVMDGIDDHLYCPATNFDLAGLEDGTWTIAGFVNFTSTIQNVYFGAAEESSANDYIAIRIETTNDYIQVYHVGGSNGTMIIEGSTALVSGTTYHIAVTMDGSGLKIYLDGVAESLTVTSGSNAQSTWSAGFLDNFTVGALVRNTTSLYVGATINDVQLINRALSAGEIALLAAGGSGDGAAPAVPDDTNEVLHLTGATGLVDQSPAGQTGITFEGDAYADVDGFHLDGAGDWIDCGDNSAWSFGDGSTDQPFTLRVRVKFNAVNTGTTQAILCKASGFNIGEWYFVEFGGQVYFRCVDGTNRIGRFVVMSVAADVWYDLAVTYDGTKADTGILMYVDGNAETTTASSGGSYSGMSNTAEVVQVGARASLFPLSGTVAIAQIINRALSAGEISALANNDNALVLKLDLADYSGTGDLLDGSGQGNHATFNGNAAVEGGVLVLDGTGDYLSSGTTGFSLTELSCACWIRTTTIDTFPTILACFDANAMNQRQFALGLTSTSQHLRVVLNGTGLASGNAIFEANLTTVNDGEWHHVSMVYDGSTPALTMFVDGIEQTLSSSATVPTSIFNSSSPFTVGALNTQATASNLFTGQMAKIRTYSAALSASQIRDLYNEDRPRFQPFGLLGGEVCAFIPSRWPGFGTLADQSGNGNDGTLNGGATVTGGVLSLDGSTGYVETATTNLGLTDGSVSAWIKLDSVTGFQIVASKGTVATRNFILYTTGDTIVWQVGVASEGATARHAGLTTGQWYHVAGTYNATSNEAMLYIDGTQQDSASYSGGFQNNTTTLQVGASTSQSLYYDGEIDQLLIYDRALSATEIKHLASARPFQTPNSWNSVLCISPSHQYAIASGSGVTEAIDLSGNANHGTLTNMDPATDWVADATSGGIAALDFDGTDDYLSVADIETPKMSILAWVKLDAFGDVIAAKRDDANYAWDLSTGGTGIVFFGPNNNANRANSGSDVLTIGSWVMVAGTFDGSTVKVYIGSEQVGSHSYSGTTADVATVVSIGRRLMTGSNAAHFDGVIDLVPLFDRALTNEQIAIWAQSRSPFAESQFINLFVAQPRRRQLILPGGTL